MNWLVEAVTRRARGLCAPPPAAFAVLSLALAAAGGAGCASSPPPLPLAPLADDGGAASAEAGAEIAPEAWPFAEAAAEGRAPQRPLLISSKGAVVAPAHGAAGSGAHTDVVAAAIDALRRGEVVVQTTPAPAGSLVPRPRVAAETPSAPEALRAPPEMVVTLESSPSPESDGEPAWRATFTRGEERAPEPEAPSTPHEFTVRTGLLSDNVRALVKDFGWQLKWAEGSDRRIEAPFAIPRDTLEATLRRLLELYEGSFVADLYQANRMVVVAPAPPGVAIRESEAQAADVAQPEARPPRKGREDDARDARREKTWLRFPDLEDE